MPSPEGVSEIQEIETEGLYARLYLPYGSPRQLLVIYHGGEYTAMRVTIPWHSR